MKWISRLAAMAAAAIVGAGLFVGAPASAQATRTWISGVGDDANPCSRTAPCKTFQGAISKTAAGGEINCIDPGGFGAVTITKSISLICDNTQAGIVVAGTSSIIINSSTAYVVISGLDLEGLGNAPTTPGIHGVNIINAAAVHIRNTKIRGFRGGFGVNFTPSAGPSQLYIDNVTITECGSTASPATTGGIFLNPQSNVTATAMISNTQLVDNANVGIRTDTTGLTNVLFNASIVNVNDANNGIGVLAKVPAGTGSAQYMVTDSRVTNNATAGILANSSAAGLMTFRVGNTTITGNGNALQINGFATISSYGDNRVNGNTNDGAFTAPLLAKK